MKKIYIAILMIGAMNLSSFAQDIDLDTFLEGGVGNANNLLEGYLEPAFAGFGYALNSGWYNTGKPHKLLGFDLTFGLNMAQVPNSANTFKFNESNFTNITLENPINPDSPLFGTNELPTLFGPNLNADDIPFLVFNSGTDDEVRFTSPTGSGIDEVLPFVAVPAPYAQFGIGLIKNTDLKIRLVPEQEVDGNSIKMFGIGVMHDVKQWIPGIKNLPFDLSGFFGYTSMETVATIDENAGQTAVFNVSGTTLQGIISKKLAILTVYGGLGFTTSKTEFKMLGDYSDILSEDPIDPINISSNNGGARANIGARLKLLILTFHVEYALQKYNTITAGVGLSLR
ncbi:MAG: hypothetical protein JXR03_05475 [Cyclobacteriaceae bacterium]